MCNVQHKTSLIQITHRTSINHGGSNASEHVETKNEFGWKAFKWYRIAALIVDYAQSFSQHSTPSNP